MAEKIGSTLPVAIDQPNTVDIVALGKENTVLLTISDHLDWTDVNSHLYLLQEKVNTYLGYIESGQLYNQMEKARDMRPVIEHVFFHEPPKEAGAAIARLDSLLGERNILFRSRAYGRKSEFTPG